MNHDISHCNNPKCSIKTDCYRYKAHLELKEKLEQLGEKRYEEEVGLYHSYLLLTKETKKKEECEYYFK